MGTGVHRSHIPHVTRVASHPQLDPNSTVKLKRERGNLFTEKHNSTAPTPGPTISPHKKNPKNAKVSLPHAHIDTARQEKEAKQQEVQVLTYAHFLQLQTHECRDACCGTRAITPNRSSCSGTPHRQSEHTQHR